MSFCLLTVPKRGSCGPTRELILLHTQVVSMSIQCLKKKKKEEKEERSAKVKYFIKFCLKITMFKMLKVHAAKHVG